MRNPASSFPAEPIPRRWYREPWPWLLIAGPLAVVVASAATLWLAIRSDDGVVAHDYYKLGLLINQRLERPPPGAPAPLRVSLRIAPGGEARLRVEGDTHPPARVRLTVGYPETSAPDEIVTLARGAEGEYAGTLAHGRPGRRVVTLESAAWRLPTTTMHGGPGEVTIVGEHR
jgi:hypothetical protein